MNLGALLDLGVDPDYLKSELAKLNIKGFHLAITKDQRKGIGGTKATVMILNQDTEHHRYLKQVEDIVNASSLSPEIKTLALKIFSIIAHAEAAVHQIDIQKVHFHEVGALDSIVDIVGAAVCLNYLKVDEVHSSPIQLGGGFVNCDHGKMPVPAPATALIVKNLPVKMGAVNHEATTPTGAAILAATVNHFSDKNEFAILKTGHGIGHRDAEIPNVLRVYLAEIEKDEAKGYISEAACLLECNIDDMNPEWYLHASELLFAAGASDVYLTPIIMKKSRPANILSVLSKPELVETLKELIFIHTSSLGIRETRIQKSMLQREEITLNTKYGNVRIKKGFFKGVLVNEKPEYDDLQRIAKENNIPIQTIYSEIMNSIK